MPEAGEASPGKGREGHRPLEAIPVAPYKKRPKGLGPIWLSWMRVGSCWFRASEGPGPHGDRLPRCAVPGVGARFRPFPSLQSLPSESTSLSMPGSTRTRTSAPPRWRPFWDSFFDTSGGPWCCCGTEGIPTKGVRSLTFFGNTRGCIRIGFPDMPRSSIRMSWFGTITRGWWQTATPGISGTVNSFSTVRSNPFDNPEGFSGRASTHRICLGKGKGRSFTYTNINNEREHHAQIAISRSILS